MTWQKINKLFYFANLFCQQLSSSDEIAYENKLKIQQNIVYILGICVSNWSFVYNKKFKLEAPAS